MKIIRNALVMLYINFICLFIEFIALMRANITILKCFFILSIATFLVIMFLLIKNAKKAVNLGINLEYDVLRKSMKSIKLGMTPVCILDFLLFCLLCLLLFVASRGLILFTPVPIFLGIPIFFVYVTIVLTSSYGIAFVVTLRRQNTITTGKLILYIILQLCFVLDIIATIVLIAKYKE